MKADSRAAPHPGHHDLGGRTRSRAWCAASSSAPRTTCRSRSIRRCCGRGSARAWRRSACATRSLRHLDADRSASSQSARAIQLGMVPTDFRLPTAAGPVEIFATLEPAREVGGDLYDFFWGEDGRLCFVIADVSGKGAPAALFMARTKTHDPDGCDASRAQAGMPLEPDRIIKKVNEELCLDNRQGMFVDRLLRHPRPRNSRGFVLQRRAQRRRIS